MNNLDKEFPKLSRARDNYLRNNQNIININPNIENNQINNLISTYFKNSKIINEECINIYNEGQNILKVFFLIN